MKQRNLQQKKSLNLVCKYMANIPRALIKAITFRILVTLLGFIIAYAVTRSIGVSLKIFAIHAVAATLLYIVNERVW